MADRTGWYEFVKPGGSTTHIAYVHEGGSVYLPEGLDVVGEEDFRLASASDRFWRLVREPAVVTTAEELDALPVGSVVLESDGSAWQKTDVDYWERGGGGFDDGYGLALRGAVTVLHVGRDRAPL